MTTRNDTDALLAANMRWADATFAYRRARAALDRHDADTATMVREGPGRVTEGRVRESVDLSPKHAELLLALHNAERAKILAFGELQAARVQLGILGGGAE